MRILNFRQVYRVKKSKSSHYNYLEPGIQECVGLLHDEKRETIHPPRPDCQANSTGGGEDAEEARCGKTGLLHRAGQPD